MEVNYNHIYLSFKDNSRAKTRQQIPEGNRHRGLYITYVSCANNVITEFYDGELFDDESWGNSNNWKLVMNTGVSKKDFLDLKKKVEELEKRIPS